MTVIGISHATNLTFFFWNKSKNMDAYARFIRWCGNETFDIDGYRIRYIRVPYGCGTMRKSNIRIDFIQTAFSNILDTKYLWNQLEQRKWSLTPPQNHLLNVAGTFDPKFVRQLFWLNATCLLRQECWQLPTPPAPHCNYIITYPLRFRESCAHAVVYAFKWGLEKIARHHGKPIKNYEWLFSLVENVVLGEYWTVKSEQCTLLRCVWRQVSLSLPI